MNDRTSAIAVKGLWKLFGEDPAGYLERMPADRSAAKIVADGYVPAVRDVSIRVASGEMLVVMGLSGSGKSTLVRCLARLLKSTAGSVEIEGRDITRLSERELVDLRRSKMGMVFQSFGLLPHRTAAENVSFPLEMRGQGADERRKRALDVLRLVGLEDRADHFPHELSGGQQQRIGIARSLAVEPDIWFLDEPFSALDPLIRREMQDEFARLRELLGRTIVFITHDFDEALRLADRIAIMKDGAIEQCDTPDRIVMEPATDYVAKFTREVDRSRVVRARSLASSNDAGDLSAAPVPADATIRELSRRLLSDARETFPVEDETGRLVGHMRRDAALDVLLGSDR